MRKQVSCWFTICVVGLVAGMPQRDKGTDDRVGLERPSTSPTPEISECGLDALIGDVFGSGGNSNCNNNNNNNNNPPPNNNGGGYQPPPNNNNGDGYQPPPNNNNGGGYQPPPNNNNDNGYQPPPNNGANPMDCECVPFYLCDDNNTIIEDGVGLIDIRLKDECGAYDQKCCGGEHVRQPDNPVITPRPPPVATENRCGIRNFDGVGVRITGAEDNEAQYGEFPWMVAVVQPDATRSQDGKPVNVYQCGGSLIHPQVVLTGAHCVRGKNNLVIRAGEWDTQTKNELYPTQDRKVQEVIIHEQFNNNTLVNDPALLILESPVDTTFENVGLICLPEENENMDGRDCVASGWGKDQFGKEGKYQVILKRVDLPIVPRGPCLEALRKTRLGTHFKLHPSFICAGGRPGKDTCKGDGGSPLACPSKANPGVYVQAGIVAWGISCNTETPGVYVNVPSFVTWIYNKLQQRGISLVGSCGNSNSKKTNNNTPGCNHAPDNNNGGHGTLSNTSNGSGYNTHSENNNNGGGYSPLPENSNGSGYNTHSEKNNNGSGYSPLPENSNGSGYNTHSENNNNGGGYSPLPENSNGSGYNTHSENNNNGVNPLPDNNSGGYNPAPDNNTSANFKGCECVPFYLCDDNNTVAEDGVGLLDIRIKDECGAYDQRCCEATNVRPPDKPVITTKPPSVVIPNKRCGIRNFDGVGVRITGAEDNEAQYGEFPWMVAVVQPDATLSQDGEPVKVYQCGGSLIHPQVVLTGAHCVRGKNNLVIRAGEWDTQTKNELYPTQDRKVQEVIIHEQFNNNTLVNDPALLILESPVDTTFENVGLICLPEENENMDGRDCVASGWGKDQFGKEGRYQVILKRVDVPIVPRGPCLEALHKTKLGTHFKLHPSFICAGGRPGKDTCKGDGGSPLACPSEANAGVYVQAGIVAWGINCGTETPGVYVNVPSFVTWIYNKLQDHGISLV